MNTILCAEQERALKRASNSAKTYKDTDQLSHQRWTRFVQDVVRQRKEDKSKNKQNPADKAATRTAWATVWIAFFTVVLAGVSYMQWRELHAGGADTHNLASAAGDQATWTQRLAGAAGTQADRTQALADHMKDQADRTKDLADQAKVQAAEATVAANAAKSAAETADRALHISERAYLAVVAAQFDFASGNVSVNIVNSGHLPSGEGEIKVFEVNGYNPNPNPAPNAVDTYPIVERHWNISQMKAVSNGAPRTYFISIPGVTADEVNNGHQVVHLGGILSYNDGFSDTPDQVSRFCIASVFDAKAKRTMLTNCDPDAGLDKLIREVGYPDNKENISDQAN